MKEKDQFTKNMLQALGNRVRALRKKAGFSNYEQFAFTHEINRVQYGGYENGKDMRFSSLLRIVKAHNITLEEFFSEGFEGQ